MQHGKYPENLRCLYSDSAGVCWLDIPSHPGIIVSYYQDSSDSAMIHIRVRGAFGITQYRGANMRKGATHWSHQERIQDIENRMGNDR
jgi:hypothetical protein